MTTSAAVASVANRSVGRGADGLADEVAGFRCSQPFPDESAVGLEMELHAVRITVAEQLIGAPR